MRRLFYIGVLFLVINACSKSTENSFPVCGLNVPTDGTWELREAQGSMMPAIKYAEGNGNLLVFKDDAYTVFKNGTQHQTGKFTLRYDTTASEMTCTVIPQGQFIYRIIYDNDSTSAKIFFNVSGNTLTFKSGCFAVDAGSTQVYVRRNQ